MFARQMFRPARTIQNHVRRYATEPPKSGGSNTLLYLGLVGALAGGGYYYTRTTGTSPASAAKQAVASAGIAAPEKTFKGGEQGFVSLKLQSVEDVNHNTKKFRFALPGGEGEVSGLPVASALLTKFQGEGMEKPVVRPYTPVSEEDARGYVDFVIKKYDKGPMSTHIHDLTPGQTLDIKGPIPKYPWSQNKHSHVAMIAGGTGITPMYQVARAILADPAERTKVTLVFANVAAEDILLKKELEEWENTYPQRFRAFYVLDSPPEGWQGGEGRVTKELLKTVLPEAKEENVKVFVCGPPGMYKAVSGTKKSPADQGELDGYLKDLGFSKDQVYKF